MKKANEAKTATTTTETKSAKSEIENDVAKTATETKAPGKSAKAKKSEKPAAGSSEALVGENSSHVYVIAKDAGAAVLVDMVERADAHAELTNSFAYSPQTATKFLDAGKVLETKTHLYSTNRDALREKFALLNAAEQTSADEPAAELETVLEPTDEPANDEPVINLDTADDDFPPETASTANDAPAISPDAEFFEDEAAAVDAPQTEPTPAPVDAALAALEAEIPGGTFEEFAAEKLGTDVESVNTALAVIDGVNESDDEFLQYEQIDKTSKLSKDEASRRDEIISQVNSELPEFNNRSALLGSLIEELKNGNEKNNFKPLYRETHKSFGKFVFDVFAISRAQALQLIVCGEVFKALTNGGVDNVSILPSQRGAQTLNKMTRDLLLTSHTATELGNYERVLTKFLWEITVRSALVVNGKPQITPAHLESVKANVERVMKDGVIEVDGQDVPVNLAGDLLDASITNETFERHNRQKDALVEGIKKASARKSEPQERKPSTPAAGDDDAGAKPSGKKAKNTLTMLCSEHGETLPKKLVFGGLVMQCGCAFIKETGKEELQFTDKIS